MSLWAKKSLRLECVSNFASLDVIGANCSDGRKQYYDRDYVAKHRPILLLKFDGKPPADWPNSEHGSWLGPYCVVHESFGPRETIYGYVEEPRSAPAVASLAALTSKDTFRKRVIDPRSFNPVSLMPPHPTFDDETFNALEAYFKATMLIEW